MFEPEKKRFNMHELDFIQKLLHISCAATIIKELFVKQDKIVLTNSYTANRDISLLLGKSSENQ